MHGDHEIIRWLWPIWHPQVIMVIPIKSHQTHQSDAFRVRFASDLIFSQEKAIYKAAAHTYLLALFAFIKISSIYFRQIALCEFNSRIICVIHDHDFCWWFTVIVKFILRQSHTLVVTLIFNVYFWKYIFFVIFGFCRPYFHRIGRMNLNCSWNCSPQFVCLQIEDDYIPIVPGHRSPVGNSSSSICNLIDSRSSGTQNFPNSCFCHKFVNYWMELLNCQFFHSKCAKRVILAWVSVNPPAVFSQYSFIPDDDD